MPDGGLLGRFKSEESKRRALAAPRTADGLRWRGKLKIPTRCHPLVKFLFSLMNEQGAQIEEVAQETNISRSTFWSWGHTRMPMLDKIEAAFNALGYKLIAVPIEDAAGSWIPKTLTAAERRVVEALLEVYPNGLHGADIAIRASTTEGSAKVFMTNIRKAGVIVDTDKPGEAVVYRLGSGNFTERSSPASPPAPASSSSQTGACVSVGS